MKKLFFITALIVFSCSLLAQKVPVLVVKSRSANPEWQILDENYNIVFKGGSYFSGDTVAFSLESNRRFFFYCMVENSSDSFSYKLILGQEPLLLIGCDDGEGDHFFPFFTGTRSYESKITGGTDALISEFPWQVYITSGDVTCGGSIISSTWIVTAAHCVKTDTGTTVSPSEVLVKAGANNPYNDAEGTVYEAAQVIPHENYNDETLENDIALIKLKIPIDNPQARPVRIITQEDIGFGATDPGVMTWVTGWGLTSLSPNVFPTRLQKVQLPIITNAQAMTVWRSIPSTDLMAGYKDGNKDACSGDSGGPMVVPVLGEFRLAGIVSWGSSKCNTYGAYTRVGLFEAWIRNNTGIQALLKPPVPSGDTIICQGRTTASYSVRTVPNISSYEWGIYPQQAGSVTGNATTATVAWNSFYIGKASLIYRVVSNGQYSDWSRLEIQIVRNTRLIRLSTDTALCSNQPVSLKVSAQGHNLEFSWYRNGSLFRYGTDSTLTFTPARPEDSGIYTVTITGSCGTVRSGPMSLTVYPLTKIISLSPDLTIPFGRDQTLRVEAGGHNLTYQWQKDSIPIGNATDSILVIRDARAIDIGNYMVTVSGTCGVERSDSIYLFVEGSRGAGSPEVFLWPSMTASTFNIAVSGDNAYNVNIYNSRGQVVKTFKNLRYQNELNITDLGGGIYIVTIYNRQFRKSLKIIRL